MVQIAPVAAAAEIGVGRWLGHRVLYGDAADPRVLDRVGSAAARVAVAVAVAVAVDRPDRAEAAVSAARAAYPRAPVLARAHDDDRRPKLERLGASVVLTETLELSLDLAEVALQRLGGPRRSPARRCWPARKGRAWSTWLRGVPRRLLKPRHDDHGRQPSAVSSARIIS